MFQMKAFGEILQRDYGFPLKTENIIQHVINEMFSRKTPQKQPSEI